MTRARVAIVALGTALGAVASGTAAATSDVDAAHEAYQRGVAAHERGDHHKAAEEFAKADSLAPNAVALQAALDEAIEADEPGIGMDLVERSARQRGTPALLASVAAARKKFAGRAGRVRIACPPKRTCLASLDGTAMDPSRPNWARVGQHTVNLQIDGVLQTRLVEVGPDATVEVSETPAPAPPGPTTGPATPASSGTTSSSAAVPPRPPPSRGLSPVVFFVGLGATAIVGGAGVAFALDTRSRHDDFVAKGCDKTNAPGCTGDADSGSGAQTTANVLLVAGGVLGVATALVGIAFTNWGGKVSIQPTQGGGVVTTLGWSGRF